MSNQKKVIYKLLNENGIEHDVRITAASNGYLLFVFRDNNAISIHSSLDGRSELRAVEKLITHILEMH